MENHPGYLHGLYPCPAPSSSSSVEGGRGVGGRWTAACYTFRVPRVISNFSVTRERERNDGENERNENIVKKRLSKRLILFPFIS